MDQLDSFNNTQKENKSLQDHIEQLNNISKELIDFSNRFAVDENVGNYIIEKDLDSDRGTTIENRYRRLYENMLLRLFDNRCANCGKDSDRLDLDHYLIPKCKFGNFLLRHRGGYYVNNAVPLCHACNVAKSSKSHTKFFSKEKLMYIKGINKRMTEYINKKGLKL